MEGLCGWLVVITFYVKVELSECTVTRQYTFIHLMCVYIMGVTILQIHDSISL